jgi:hypothetical protein
MYLSALQCTLLNSVQYTVALVEGGHDVRSFVAMQW